MTQASLLPPIPRPPHDPTWLALDAIQGWRASSLDGAVLSEPDGVLQLAVASGSRSVTEASGSFGGLVAPDHVAADPSYPDDVYLLDRTSQTLRKFDACDCVFRTIPGIGHPGNAPRQFDDARAIALAHGNLYVADTGNARVSVFSANEYALRGAFVPPASAELANPWTPVAVAVDTWGRCFVADPANGGIHRFGRSGVWQTLLSGLGAVRHLAIDSFNRLYVVIDAEDAVRVLDPRGVELERVTDVAALASRFAPLPFRVDRHGALDMPCGAFDMHGAALPGGAVQDVVKFAAAGTYISDALDSRIHRCQWHRVLLSAEIPAGTSVLVETYTSDVALPPDVVAALPDDAWQTNQVARGVSGGWDCLIRSGGGRYGWLKLTLSGGGPVTPRVCRVRVEFPRISLRRYLPSVFGDDPIGADFTDRFLGLFDTTFRSIEATLDQQARLFDPRSTPSSPDSTSGVDFLTWLASWVGLTLDRQWPEAKRRAFVRLAPKLYDVRGTRQGLWKILLLYLGLDTPLVCEGGCASPAPETRSCGCGCASNTRRRVVARCRPRPSNCDPEPPRPAWQPPPLILEHFALRRWLHVGAGRLGDQAVLWGRSIVNRSRLGDGAQADRSQLIMTQDPLRDPFHVYASKFTVFVPASVGQTAQQRKSLDTLLAAESPAHTEYSVSYVAPRFRIGVQSMIGLDAVVGRYPAEGVTVGATTLGGQSVLGASPDEVGPDGQPRPSLRIGSRSRIGATTRLD